MNGSSPRCGAKETGSLPPMQLRRYASAAERDHGCAKGSAWAAGRRRPVVCVCPRDSSNCEAAVGLPGNRWRRKPSCARFSGPYSLAWRSSPVWRPDPLPAPLSPPAAAAKPVARSQHATLEPRCARSAPHRSATRRARPARDPLHGAREVEEVWCPQPGSQASPPLPVQAPGLGVGPKGFGHGTGPANFGFAAGLAVLEFDGPVDDHDGYAAAGGLVAATRLARPSACRDLGIRRLRERRCNARCGGRA